MRWKLESKVEKSSFWLMNLEVAPPRMWPLAEGAPRGPPGRAACHARSSAAPPAHCQAARRGGGGASGFASRGGETSRSGLGDLHR